MAMENYFTFLGLCFDIVGAVLILSGVHLSKLQAIDTGLMRLGGTTIEENLKNPLVVNLLVQSRRALWGTVSLIVGFVLQAVAVWPF